MTGKTLSRRGMVSAAGAAFFMPAILQAQNITETDAEAPLAPVRHNTSGFKQQNWQDHFKTLGKAAIVADTGSRALHFWSGDGEVYNIYPTSVPRSDELTKRGYTKIVRKRIGPDWTPTPSMIERDPELKYMPAGPGNPLGSHAMYLDWPAYLIHGTHDTRKIGRQSSDGCIGLYNHMVEALYQIAPIGTQVRII